ncbi:MAG: hypothetical protein ACI85I_001708 [Arenicella sp.]|jgi:hypothetical protein
MKKIGGYLLLFGISSFILYFLDMEFMLLMWVDMWGETIGFAIKGAIVVAGAVMFFARKSDDDEGEIE